MSTVSDSISTITLPRPPFEVPPTVVEALDPADKDALRAEIKTLLKREDAVLIAHYYTDAALQELADETGG